MKRKISKGWKFWENDDSFALIWNINDKAIDVELPHDAMISKERNPNSSNGGNSGFFDGGVYYYVKQLEIGNCDKEYSLQFDGVHNNASVYVNGQFCGENKFGYNSFNVDINDAINYNGMNEVRVIVKNNNQSSRWYTGGGIYRDVYLVEEEFVRVENIRLTTKHTDKDINSACVNVEFTVVNDTPVKQKGNIIVSIDDIELSLPIIAFGNSSYTYNKDITIDNCRLWDEYNPYLYDVCIESNFNSVNVVDIIKFGIRTITVDSKNGLKVNGETVKLRGACIHHDSGILGSKTYYDYDYYKLSKMKTAGFNAIRMAHNPVSNTMLRACDELGIYVMDETFDMWQRSKSDYDFSLNFEKEWENELELLVANDYNHPSVIMYSLGNEIPELGFDKGVETLNRLNNKLKRLDNTRVSLISINGVFAAGDSIPQILEDVLKQNGDFSGNVNNFMQVMDKYMDDIVRHPIISEILDNLVSSVDILGYNYMTARYAVDQNKQRVIVGSETYPPNISENWSEITKYDNVIGDFTWTGWDYIGEAGVGIPAYKFGDGGFGAQYPARLAYCGDFDLIGNRRPMSYCREIVFGQRTNPYITVTNPFADKGKLITTPWVMSDSKSTYSFDYDGNIDVEVFSAGDQVQLLINDKLVETKPVIGHVARFTCQYIVGEIKAVSLSDTEVIGVDTVKTIQEASSLNVDVIAGSDKELLFVEIMQQANGEIDYKNKELELIVTNGELLAFGNGNPKSLENYTNNISSTFDGHALAIFKFEEGIEFELNGKKYQI